MVSSTQWSQRVSQWRVSGQTARAYCVDKDFEFRRLLWWSWELGRRSKEATPSVKAAPRPLFLPARVVPSSPPSGITLLIGGVKIAIDGAFDEALLGKVVRTLEANQ